MRARLVLIALAATAVTAHAQPGKFPPDTLANVRVFPKATPVMQLVGTMRNFTSALGVRCTHCHVGQEGQPLNTVDFASDEKRTKLVARQMMLMAAEINRRLDSIPGRMAGAPTVGCTTCHRGVARPMPLGNLLADAAIGGGADSATRAYRALRQRHYGRDAYDFGEPTLGTAAFRAAQRGKHDDALALLTLNEEYYPMSSSTSVTRGNVLLMKGDTAGAAGAFREAIRRDTLNAEAKGRLRDIGQRP